MGDHFVFHKQRLLLIVVALANALAISGCGTLNSNAVTAAAFNMAAEREGNKLLLLNIVRAMHRHPLYLTSISQLRGSNTFGVGLDSFEIPFGRGTADPFKPSAVFSISGNPSYDIGLLDSKEFMQGFLSPISMTRVDYYWNQGWSKELLLLLFVERIVYHDRVLENYPPARAAFARFREEVQHLLKCASKDDPCLQINKEPDVVFQGLSIDTTSPDNFATLIEADKAGLAIERMDRTTYRIVRQRNDFVFTTQDGKQLRTPAKASGSVAPVIHLRSPEGIIYYIGELVRIQMLGDMDGPRLPVTLKVCEHASAEAPLFELDRDRPRKSEAAVSVEYASHQYAIPETTDREMINRCAAPRTMSVLALVGQLIALQRSANDQPTTAAVQVVGR